MQQVDGVAMAVSVAFYEIYCGKLFDLLNGRQVQLPAASCAPQCEVDRTTSRLIFSKGTRLLTFSHDRLLATFGQKATLTADVCISQSPFDSK